MKSPTSRRWHVAIRSIALFAAITSFATSASAGVYTNNFSSPTGGLKDATGNDIGLTTRLPGTGSSLSSPNDSLLTLGSGVLTINSGTTNTDINGNSNPEFLEAIGIPLASIGFTGVEDFIVTATYTSRTIGSEFAFPDQFGLFVGYDDENMYRAGLINFVPVNGNISLFGAVADGGVDTDGQFDPTTDPDQIAGSFEVKLQRIGGIYKAFIDNVEITGLNQPSNLDGNLLYAGLVVSNISGAAFDATVTDFTAVVVPEPSSAMLMLFAVMVLPLFRRLR